MGVEVSKGVLDGIFNACILEQMLVGISGNGKTVWYSPSF
jgi:hypothetical protein